MTKEQQIEEMETILSRNNCPHHCIRCNYFKKFGNTCSKPFFYTAEAIYENGYRKVASKESLAEDVFSDITKTFLEPSCGEGAFLCEIFERKLKYCKNEKDGLKALNSLFGIDIQADNVLATRKT